MIGVKLWMAVKASDPRVQGVAEKAVALDVPVLQHVWIKASGNGPGESIPDDVAALSRAVPHCRLIMGRLNGGGLRGIEAVADLPGVAVASLDRTSWRDRPVFGSHASIFPPEAAFARIVLDLDDPSADRILAGNATAPLPPAR